MKWLISKILVCPKLWLIRPKWPYPLLLRKSFNCLAKFVPSQPQYLLQIFFLGACILNEDIGYWFLSNLGLLKILFSTTVYIFEKFGPTNKLFVFKTSKRKLQGNEKDAELRIYPHVMKKSNSKCDYSAILDSSENWKNIFYVMFRCRGCSLV